MLLFQNYIADYISEVTITGTAIDKKKLSLVTGLS